MTQITLVGGQSIGPNAPWTSWMAPSDVCIDDLPLNVYLVYQIGCISLGNLPDSHIDLSEAVMYLGEGKRTLGLADCGKVVGRYRELVVTWTNQNVNGPHDSYRRWVEYGLEAVAPLEHIRIRYKPLGKWDPLSWKGDINPLKGKDDFVGRELVVKKTRQLRRDRSSNEELEAAGMLMRPETDIPFYFEAKLLREFELEYGRLPTLNEEAGDDLGGKPSTEWMDQHLDNMS